MELYNEQTERWMDEHVEETQQLLRTLCQIPAPSHHEEKRAEFCAAPAVGMTRPIWRC